LAGSCLNDTSPYRPSTFAASRSSMKSVTAACIPSMYGPMLPVSSNTNTISSGSGSPERSISTTSKLSMVRGSPSSSSAKASAVRFPSWPSSVSTMQVVSTVG